MTASATHHGLEPTRRALALVAQRLTGVGIAGLSTAQLPPANLATTRNGIQAGVPLGQRRLAARAKLHVEIPLTTITFSLVAFLFALVIAAGQHLLAHVVALEVSGAVVFGGAGHLPAQLPAVALLQDELVARRAVPGVTLSLTLVQTTFQKLVAGGVTDQLNVCATLNDGLSFSCNKTKFLTHQSMFTSTYHSHRVWPP